ncbi:hypothetical protein K439DRAFT_1659015 [Ramaria rubella]|nr:hypothetical protein K439DRAFT_1659015 [Ramaria rubella]
MYICSRRKLAGLIAAEMRDGWQWTVESLNFSNIDETVRGAQSTVSRITMAGKSKAKTLIVRLISTAQTGFFYTKTRPRQGAKLAAIKYDPVAKSRVLFVESRKKK